MLLASVRENAGGTLELGFGSKLLYLVRHGQSVANTYSESDKMDPILRDAKLTPLGESQAAALAGKVAQWRVQVVIASPLSRALQTSCLAFANETTPIVAWPLVTEFYGEYPECQGRPRADIAADPVLNALPRFRGVCLDNVGPEWWTVANDESRLHTFLSWLRACPETRICVVAHWGFIHHLMALMHCGAALDIANCCQIETLWHPLTAPVIDTERVYAVWLVPRSPTTCDLLAQLEDFMADCRADPVLSQTTLVTRSNAQPHISLSDFVPLTAERLGVLCTNMAKWVTALLLQRGKPWCLSADSFKLALDNEHHAVWLRLGLGSGFLHTLGGTLASAMPDFKVAARQDLLRFTFLVDDRPTGCLPLAQWQESAARYPLVSKLIEMALKGESASELLAPLVTVSWDICIASRRTAGGGWRLEPGMRLPLD